jgi:hypothetical protein
MSERSAPAQDHGVILQVNGVILQGHSIIEVLWPNILNAWLTKEQWAGCTELDEELQLKWKTAKLCLQACKKLESAKTAILTVSQLYTSHGQWSPFADLRQRNCHLSREEHTALINCLLAADVSGLIESQLPCGRHWQPWGDQFNVSQSSLLVKPPPCIIGKVRRVAEHNQLELESLSDIIPDMLTTTVSSAQLV